MVRHDGFTRTNLIRAVAPAVQKRTGRTSSEVNAMLEALTTAELQEMYRKQAAAGLLQEQPSQDEVEEVLAKIRAKAQQDPAVVQGRAEVAQEQAARVWQRFFFNHPDIVDTQANRTLLYERAFSLVEDGPVTLRGHPNPAM